MASPSAPAAQLPANPLANAPTTTSPTIRNKRPRPPDLHGDNPTEDPFQHEEGDEDEEDEDEDGAKVKVDKKAGRRKIKIEFIQDKSRRHITFSKRKAGIMKKAYELSTLTGTQVLLLVVSETGLVYTFTTAKLQPLVTQPEGKNLIQACLNAPNGTTPAQQQQPPPPDLTSPQPVQSNLPPYHQPHDMYGPPPQPGPQTQGHPQLMAQYHISPQAQAQAHWSALHAHAQAQQAAQAHHAAQQHHGGRR
ncbi:hypothetical protein BOTBODRAFT_40971 [Botryobasidium botryosum FD-172 SS1]|uniref:MADS-box domain-containing protein n=1 Tax=Botryobasidium botryosum (strain FD-172 SS1) TaxID=930990 RepID=A0A067MYY8_BOTB1|nr:hypothetical protein BOTBODRAFT_40971 [Botryobasidium botryosum FD-172 SS1]